MTILIYSLAGLFVPTFVMLAIFFVKYNTLHNKVKTVLAELYKKQTRKGYYKLNYTQTIGTGEVIKFEVICEVKEIEKYTDDISKIELEKIEIIAMNSNLNRESAISTAKNDFCSLRKTSNINWLELEISLKEQRKEKLNKLKSAIN